MITSDRWLSFFAWVRDVRELQRIYRETLDPMIRRECEKAEVSLDVIANGIAADLRTAAEAVEAEEQADAVVLLFDHEAESVKGGAA